MTSRNFGLSESCERSRNHIGTRFPLQYRFGSAAVLCVFGLEAPLGWSAVGSPVTEATMPRRPVHSFGQSATEAAAGERATPVPENSFPAPRSHGNQASRGWIAWSRSIHGTVCFNGNSDDDKQERRLGSNAGRRYEVRRGNELLGKPVGLLSGSVFGGIDFLAVIAVQDTDGDAEVRDSPGGARAGGRVSSTTKKAAGVKTDGLIGVEL